MSHHSHLLLGVRSRAPRQAQPFDSLSKAKIWEQLQLAERALSKVRSAAQSAATMAHDYAQGASGEQRRQLLALRDAAYRACDASRS